MQVCDKIMFRSVGVISLLVFCIYPQNLPFDDDWPLWLWPAVWPSFFCWGRVCALLGGLICVICWFTLNQVLNETEENMKKEIADADKKLAERS